MLASAHDTMSHIQSDVPIVHPIENISALTCKKSTAIEFATLKYAYTNSMLFRKKTIFPILHLIDALCPSLYQIYTTSIVIPIYRYTLITFFHHCRLLFVVYRDIHAGLTSQRANGVILLL